MKTFTRDTTRTLANEVEAALQKLLADRGITVKYKGGSFTTNNATLKIEFATVSESGEVNTREASDFKALAKVYGLEPTDLGRTFTSGGVTYTITGLKSRSHRYPVLVKRNDGRTFKFPADRVRFELSRTAA